MQRYLLFAGRSYYPIGGAWDYQGSFPTLGETQQHILANQSKLDHYDRWDWYHVIDTLTGECVQASGHSCYGDPNTLKQLPRTF